MSSDDWNDSFLSSGVSISGGGSGGGGEHMMLPSSSVHHRGHGDDGIGAFPIS